MFPRSTTACHEIFGPVISIVHVDTIEEAINSRTPLHMAMRLLFIPQMVRLQIGHEGNLGYVRSQYRFLSPENRLDLVDGTTLNLDKET